MRDRYRHPHFYHVRTRLREMNLVAQGSPLVCIRSKNQTGLASSARTFDSYPNPPAFREPTGSQEKVASELSLERILTPIKQRGVRDSVKGTEYLEQK